MDFKVAGTKDGITAIQMDIKIHGLTRQIIEEAIARTRTARFHILDEVMNPVIAEASSLFDDYNEKRVYKKQGIIEKYIGSFDGGDEDILKPDG